MRYDDLLPERELNLAAFLFPAAWGPKDLAWLDIEGVKVKAPESWSQQTRTKAFMVGIGRFVEDGFLVHIYTGKEEYVMNAVKTVAHDRTLVYYATRDYDRMVLEGKWTQFRRSMSDRPGDWPNVGDGWFWQNLRDITTYQRMTWDRLRSIRSPDVESKAVPEIWTVNPDLVILHNVRDVIELAVLDSRAGNLLIPKPLYSGNYYQALEILQGYEIFNGPM